MGFPFTIRQATEADLPAICAVDEEAFAPYGTAEEPAVFAARLAVFPAGFIVLEGNNGDATTILGYGCSEKWGTERTGVGRRPIVLTGASSASPAWPSGTPAGGLGTARRS